MSGVGTIHACSLSVFVHQDEVLGLLLQSCRHLIVSYHEHDSLLDHREEEELSEEERRVAWDEYRAEKRVYNYYCWLTILKQKKY